MEYQPSKERMERTLKTDQERLRAIQEQVPRSAKGQNDHRRHVDHLKRRVDEAAKRLDL